MDSHSRTRREGAVTEYPQITNSAGTPLLEVLEPRLLLDAAFDWTGTWRLTGAEFEAEDWGGGAAYALRGHTVRISEAAAPGIDYIGTVAGIGLVIPFTAVDNELRMDTAGWNEWHEYALEGVRMVYIGPDAALVMSAEGGFSGPDLQNLWFAGGFVGLATRGVVPMTPRPWEGEYVVTEYVAEMSAPEGLSIGMHTFDLTMTDLGGGVYEAYNHTVDGTAQLRRSGNVLISQTEGVDNGHYYAEFFRLQRGPYDTLYALGGFAGFDASQTHLQSAALWVAVVEPKAGSQYLPDLTAEIVPTSVPAAVLAEGAFRTQVVVTNAGTAPAVGRGAICLYASTDDTLDVDTDRLIGELPNALLSLGVGRQGTFSIRAEAPLEPGEYYLLVHVDADNAIAEIDEDNVFAGPLLTVDEPFVDLTAQFAANLNLPMAVVAGDGTRVRLPLEVRNEGNVAIDHGQRIDVDILARPAGGGDDVHIVTLANQPIGNLRPGAMRRLNAIVTLPTSLMGTYHLVAYVDASDEVEEKYEDNNEAVTAATIEVAEGFVDLTAQFAANLSLPTMLVAGDGTRLRLSLEVRNEGNVAIDRGQRIAVSIAARPGGAGDDIHVETIDNLPIGNLRPGAVRRLNLLVTLPAGLSGDYTLVAIVDANDDVDEKYEDNNEAIAPEPITLAAGFFDLTGYNALGSSWTYEGRSGGVGGPAVGIVDSTVGPASGGAFVLTQEVDTFQGSFATERQSFTWAEDPDGVYLTRRWQEIDLGMLELTYDGLLVAPGAMAMRQRYTSSAAAEMDFEMDYIISATAHLAGTATATFSLLGYQTITVPAGTYRAARLSVSIRNDVSGDLDAGAGGVYPMRMVLNESYTLWAVPGVGVVQSVNNLNTVITFTGLGRQGAGGRETLRLTDYHLLA